MDERTPTLAAESLAQMQSPLTKNWFVRKQLPQEDRTQLYQLLGMLLHTYAVVPPPLRAALTMIGAAPDHARQDVGWCVDLLNQAIAQLKQPSRL